MGQSPPISPPICEPTGAVMGWEGADAMGQEPSFPPYVALKGQLLWGWGWIYGAGTSPIPPYMAL